VSHPHDHLHDLVERPVPNLRRTVEERLTAHGDPAHDIDLAHAGVRALLRLMGDDPSRPGLADTPKRVIKAMTEMASAPGHPADLLAVTFDDAGPVDSMVVVGPIPFTSLCEHHLLPFTGDAWVGYLPERGVVGLSKIPRLVEHFARRPQVQERLTAQITSAFDAHVPSSGSACVMRAVHSCAEIRGVRKRAPMTTASLTGEFRADPTVRAEFLSWVKEA
jgi:GTP cyclohydrolase I